MKCMRFFGSLPELLSAGIDFSPKAEPSGFTVYILLKLTIDCYSLGIDNEYVPPDMLNS